MVETNILGVAYTLRATLAHLKAARGHVLITGSVAGRRTLTGSMYSATNWAVTAIAYGLREELRGTGVRVTLIEPGTVDTPLFDAPKPEGLTPEDIARAVLYALEQPPTRRGARAHRASHPAARMTLPIVFHPDYMAPLRPGHPFPMSKYGYLREALVARRLLPPAGGFLSPAPASVARVAAVHALPYVERVANQTLTPAEARAIGLPNTAAVARRSFLAAAGTLLAARLALEHGVACNMAGGSHHAGPEGGAGYCVFNDVAVAAQALLDEGVLARVLVVDCDVHQGDGTARIFAGRTDVLTLSLHAERNYPARKARSAPRLPAARPPRRPRLPRGPRPRPRRSSSPSAPRSSSTTPASTRTPPTASAASPSATPASAPATAWSPAGRAARRLPLVGVLGGGYDNEPERLAARHAILFEEAARAADGETHGQG